MQTAQDPLLLRAVRGEQVERPPVWMMRQAGRYMKARLYTDADIGIITFCIASASLFAWDAEVCGV